MSLEDRLTSHFEDITEEMTSPPPRLDAVLHAGSSRSFLGRFLLAGTIGVAGLISLGLALSAVEDFGRGDDRSTRVVVNTQTRLTEQTDLELFTVSADQPSYWRIAGLDTYEDDVWKVAGEFFPEDGQLAGQDLGGERLEVTQEYKIRSLDAIWLPAASSPTEILYASAEITWNPQTSSLTVANDLEDSNGVEYRLISRVPRFSVEELRAAPETIPVEISTRYLDLPAELTAQVASLANELTAGQSTRYDKMRVLQDHFRTYTYSDGFEPSNGDPIEHFLDEREGFSQQFAGTFALMARSVGAPARVATGFTWGDAINQPDPETGMQTYSVTGRHAHAWPEVYFDGLGWVAFEPTPGRGIPSATNYTGIPAAQSSAIQPNNP